MSLKNDLLAGLHQPCPHRKSTPADLRIQAFAVQPAKKPLSFTVSDTLLEGCKPGATMGEDLLPAYHALIGTDMTPETGPLKRLELLGNYDPLIEEVAQLPLSDLQTAFGKIVMPFSSFWLEMPMFNNDQVAFRLAHWCRVDKNGTLRASNHYKLMEMNAAGGFQAATCVEPEEFIISRDGIDVENFQYLDTKLVPDRQQLEVIDMFDRRAKKLMAALVVLRSRANHSAAFRPETEGELRERMRLAKYNLNCMRDGRQPKLSPLAPIRIVIGARKATTSPEAKARELKQLLGITSVIGCSYVNFKGTEVNRRPHDRKFRSDVEVDRRPVTRQVTTARNIRKTGLVLPGLPGWAPKS